MSSYLTVLALTLLPAFGNFAGGIAAEMFRVSQRTLSFALHAAAGIILAVVGIELMPQALEVGPAWLILLLFMAGGAFAALVDRVLTVVRTRTGSSGGDAGPSAIYFGVAVDLFSDGVIIGTGSTIEFGLALLLALGQLPGDVPEGFATIATFKAKGVSRRRRLLLSASFAIPIVLGATIGYWGVRGQPDVVQFGLLAFTAGILLTVAVEEIVVQAHEDGESRLASMFLVGGFALFGLLSAYLG